MATGWSSAQNRNHLPLWLREAPLPPMPASRQSDISEPFAPSLGLPELNDPGDETAPRYTAANDPPRLPQSDSLRVQLPSGATDWLRSLGMDDDDDNAPAIAPSSAAPETGDPLESLDWLNVSSEDLSRDLPPDPVPDPVSKYTEGGELPSWLQSFAADATDATDIADNLSDAGLPSLDESIPSWLASESGMLGLQSTADAPTAPPGSDSLPAWLKAELAADDNSPDTTDSVPSWLRDVTSDAKSPSAAKPGEESIPAWLKAEIDPADLATETATTAPDWVGARDSAPRADDAGLPAWMLDAGDAGVPAPPLDAADDAGLSAWMLDDDSAGLIPPAPPLDAADDAGLPAWMLDDDSAGLIPPALPLDAADDAGLPAWMLDAGDAGVPAPPLDAADDAGLPSWMLDAGDAGVPAPPLDAADDAGLPAWMLDASDAPSVGSEPPRADDMGLPAWMTDAGDAGVPAPPLDAADDAGLPAWMTDAGDAGVPAPPLDAADDAGLPAWMLDAGDTPSVGSEPPRADDMGLPAWMLDASDTPSVGSEPPRADDMGLPSWMTDAGDTGASPAAPLDAAADADLPAWMLDVGDAPSVGSEPPRADDAGLPSWMLDDVDPSVGSSLPDVDASLPAWMLDAGDAGASPAAPLDAAADADLPSWMLDDATPSSPPSASPAAPLDAADDADLPSWMLDDATPSPPPSASPSPAAPPTAPVLPSAPSGADMPSWLLDDEQSGEPPLPGTSESALPAWLRGAEADPISTAPPAGTPPRRTVPLEPITPGENTGAFLGVTDLPAWLRQPEPEPDAPLQSHPGDISVTEVRAVNWLSNLGREQDDGNLSVSPEAQATTPTIQLALPTFSRTPAQLQAVSLLNGLLQQPYPEAAPLPQAAPPKAWEKIGLERVLYVLLALVLLIGALQPNLAGEMRFRPAGATDTAAVLEQLNTLSANDTVLLAYEWDAQRISELQPLERAVRDHLIDQEVGFISVSTDPQGTILSFDLRDALQGAGYQGQGIDYILLGYRPGGELALRSLAQNFRATLRSDFTGRDASQGALANDLATGDPRLETINDLAMIVVMADQVQDVQGWMEQVVPRTNDVPVVFLLPAEIAPVVQPYLEQPNIYALVGKGDALAYDATRQVTRSETLSAPLLDGQVAFAIFAFLMLLLLGIVLSPLFILKKER